MGRLVLLKHIFDLGSLIKYITHIFNFHYTPMYVQIIKFSPVKTEALPQGGRI